MREAVDPSLEAQAACGISGVGGSGAWLRSRRNVIERNIHSQTPRDQHGSRTANEAYAADEAIAGASASAVTSMRSGIVIVTLPSRSSSQRALTIVTPMTSPASL